MNDEHLPPPPLLSLLHSLRPLNTHPDQLLIFLVLHFYGHLLSTAAAAERAAVALASSPSPRAWISSVRLRASKQRPSRSRTGRPDGAGPAARTWVPRIETGTSTCNFARRSLSQMSRLRRRVSEFPEARVKKQQEGGSRGAEREEMSHRRAVNWPRGTGAPPG